jgi:hypothetical protein
LLVHLASSPGCTVNVATISNRSGNLAKVILLVNDKIVVWRGPISSDQTVTVAYRIVQEGHVTLRVELPEGLLSVSGDYITPMAALPEVFVIEHDRISMIPATDLSPWAWFVRLHAPLSCVVQSVLDLTGAPDPAKLNLPRSHSRNTGWAARPRSS